MDCFEGAKSFNHYKNVDSALLKTEDKSKLSLEDMVKFYNEMGFVEEGRMLCYFWIEKSETSE